MTDHPITPPPELYGQWYDESPDDDELGLVEHIATQAARWAADQQLEQDAKWLDTTALFSSNLTITPSGNALRQVMRPKPPSLKEQALETLQRISEDKYPCNYQEDSDWATIEALPDD